ncbi:hypothetical protein MRB53_041843 [Persea americana]|nr:hypothetical protein MRB53_041843 [Persea americana]
MLYWPAGMSFAESTKGTSARYMSGGNRHEPSAERDDNKGMCNLVIAASSISLHRLLEKHAMSLPYRDHHHNNNLTAPRRPLLPNGPSVERQLVALENIPVAPPTLPSRLLMTA